MSLINEALKKAQKQRTGDAPSLTSMPGVGGESAERIARRGKSSGGPNLLLWAGVGVAALGIVIAGTVLVLRRPATPAVPAATTAAAPVMPPKPVEPAPLPVAPAATAPTPAPATALAVPSTPAIVPAQSAPAVAASANPPLATTVILAPVETPKPVEPAAVQLAPEPAKPAAPAAPTVARKLEPRAINFINSIRVAGIRAATTDSKVLMMDRVYRVGDIVEAEMGLTLVGITAGSLTFEDGNGARFTRNF